MKCILNICTAALLSAGTFSSFAQPVTLYDLNTTLDDIIKEMRNDKNPNFILVQAYKDGLIKEGEPYYVKYMAGVISIDDKVLPAYEQQRYGKMYRDAYGKHSGSMMSSMRGDGLTLAKIMDRESHYWYSDGRPVNSTWTSTDRQRKSALKLIAEQMEKDGLMNDPKNYSISFDPGDGVKLNGQMPPPHLYKKYERLCIAYIGHEPKDENDRFSHSYSRSK